MRSLTSTSSQLRTCIDEVMKELDRVNPVRDGTIVTYINNVKKWQSEADMP